MTVIADPSTELTTLSDLLKELGDIPPNRVLLKPPPGTATVQDVVDLHNRRGRLYELVDGTLVEKGMGFRESLLAGTILMVLKSFVEPRNLGLVTGEAGMVRLFPDLVRIPDVAFVSWTRIPSGRVPTEPVPHLAPNLAVEVLSESNTVKEMQKKREEYFAAGVEIVWIFDPEPRIVDVYTSPENYVRLRESDVLEGGKALSGFSVPLRQVFEVFDQRRQP